MSCVYFLLVQMFTAIPWYILKVRLSRCDLWWKNYVWTWTLYDHVFCELKRWHLAPVIIVLVTLVNWRKKIVIGCLKTWRTMYGNCRREILPPLSCLNVCTYLMQITRLFLTDATFKLKVQILFSFLLLQSFCFCGKQSRFFSSPNCLIKHNTTTTTFVYSLFSRTTWVSWHQKSRTIMIATIWIYSSKRQWVAVASAGPHANLHLASDR